MIWIVFWVASGLATGAIIWWADPDEDGLPVAAMMAFILLWPIVIVVLLGKMLVETRLPRPKRNMGADGRYSSENVRPRRLRP